MVSIDRWPIFEGQTNQIKDVQCNDDQTYKQTFWVIALIANQQLKVLEIATTTRDVLV